MGLTYSTIENVTAHAPLYAQLTLYCISLISPTDDMSRLLTDIAILVGDWGTIKCKSR